MKPLVIYHKHCTDGFGAAFAAWLKLGDEAEYLPMQYRRDASPDMVAELVRNREVYMLDFSMPKLCMEHIFQAAKRVVWLDHHKTAFEMWCGAIPRSGYWLRNAGEQSIPLLPVNATVWLDNGRSGALLAWEYFHPNTEVPMLIKHIDDRDRWQFKLNGSKELHAALSSYKPWSFEQWEQHFKVGGVRLNALIDTGRDILRAQDQHVASMVKQARKCAFRNLFPPPEGWASKHEHWEPYPDECHRAGLAVNASLHQSEVGDELANQSGTYGLVWYVGDDLRVRCSLRSNGDYDVSGIARAFGGGGHRNAAGFETDITTLMGWLK